MIPELGLFFLILAFINACFLGTLPFYGAATQHQGLINFSRKAAFSQFILVAASFSCLVIAFVQDDFSVAYVASNSNTQLPLYYKTVAIWGAHEGSLLLGVLFLALWTWAVAVFSKALPGAFLARVLAVLGLISVGFTAFSLFTSNPFERALPFIPIDGADLNPLLQDFGFVIHPPMLFVGSMGFAVAFAFAIAGLLENGTEGKLDHHWAKWSRPWTQIAWVLLTIGIALGSWWAYYELGWGGWWFWDPVENASFMPWLCGTALLHSLAATEKRGVFKAWTVFLAILAFSFSLLGSFLVRSGVITSVHSFASDPTRGQFLLVFLGLVVGASFILYAVQVSKIESKNNYALYSKEMAILFNNVFLSICAFVVLLGTLYPLLVEAFTEGKSSVGPPYFNFMFSIFFLPLLLLMPVGQQIAWKQQTIGVLLKKYLLAFVSSIFMGFVLVWLVADKLEPMAVVGSSLGLWVIAGCFKYIQLQATKGKSFKSGLKKISASYWAMLIAHIGVAVTVIGIVITSYYSIEKDIRISPKQTVHVNGLDVTFNRLENIKGPNYISSKGDFTVHKNGQWVANLFPEKRKYDVSKMVLTEADIDPSLIRDVYIALGEPLDDGAWAIRVYYKPFVRWIWLGGILMALGGLIALSDKRYRRKSIGTINSDKELQP